MTGTFLPDFDPARYGPVCAELLAGSAIYELGPGQPRREHEATLRRLTSDNIAPERSPSDRSMALCCLSGLWLLHNFLDESHSLSQGIATSSGSYWHGLMHRREPDFGNAKYWFRRVGRHPVFVPLLSAARRLADELAAVEPQTHLQSATAFDPFWFVDVNERVQRGNSPHEAWCRAVAGAEWQLLFDFCFRQAFCD